MLSALLQKPPTAERYGRGDGNLAPGCAALLRAVLLGQGCCGISSRPRGRVRTEGCAFLLLRGGGRLLTGVVRRYCSERWRWRGSLGLLAPGCWALPLSVTTAEG